MRLFHACSIAALAAAAIQPAKAQTPEEFFRGKSIQFIIGYEAGSGYDLYARLLARSYGKFIPGNPAVVAINMPGAGSIRAANSVYERSPRAGTHILMTGRGTPMTPLLGGKGATFKDNNSFTWIGSMNNEVSVCVAMKESGFTDISQVMTREFTTGATSLGADDTTVFPAVLNAMIGTKFKWITGYQGGAAMNIAMERGETHGRCGWSWSSVKSTHPEWLASGRINILLQLSLAKHSELPNVPFIMDFAKTAEQKAVLELIFARQVMGRPVFGPPEMPQDRVIALRRAFDAVMKDETFLAEARKGDWEVNPVSGEVIEALMKRVYETPTAIVEKTKEVTPQPR